MGKKKQKHNDAGYREMNPTDAFRKFQRNKEKKRNKLERKKVREEAILRKDPQKICDELKKYSIMEVRGELDLISRRRKEKLEAMWIIAKRRFDIESSSNIIGSNNNKSTMEKCGNINPDKFALSPSPESSTSSDDDTDVDEHDDSDEESSSCETEVRKTEIDVYSSNLIINKGKNDIENGKVDLVEKKRKRKFTNNLEDSDDDEGNAGKIHKNTKLLAKSNPGSAADSEKVLIEEKLVGKNSDQNNHEMSNNKDNDIVDFKPPLPPMLPENVLLSDIIGIQSNNSNGKILTGYPFVVPPPPVMPCNLNDLHIPRPRNLNSDQLNLGHTQFGEVIVDGSTSNNSSDCSSYTNNNMSLLPTNAYFNPLNPATIPSPFYFDPQKSYCGIQPQGSINNFANNSFYYHNFSEPKMINNIVYPKKNVDGSSMASNCPDFTQSFILNQQKVQNYPTKMPGIVNSIPVLSKPVPYKFMDDSDLKIEKNFVSSNDESNLTEVSNISSFQPYSKGSSLTSHQIHESSKSDGYDKMQKKNNFSPLVIPSLVPRQLMVNKDQTNQSSTISSTLSSAIQVNRKLSSINQVTALSTGANRLKNVDSNVKQSSVFNHNYVHTPTNIVNFLRENSDSSTVSKDKTADLDKAFNEFLKEVDGAS